MFHSFPFSKWTYVEWLVITALVGAACMMAIPVITSHPVNPYSGRAIALAIQSYAADHDDALPSGNSSTQIFQQLYMGGYLDNPNQVYIAENQNGKQRLPVGNPLILAPENVCWDITVRVDKTMTMADFHSNPNLPLLISTGLGEFDYVDGINRKDFNPHMNTFGSSGVSVVYNSLEMRQQFTANSVFPHNGYPSVKLTGGNFKTKHKHFRNLTP